MNLLILTGHPAQIHNLRVIRDELTGKGHQVFWMATDKDVSKHLLDYFSIDYTRLEKPGKTLHSKVATLIRNTYRTFKLIREQNIDLIISRVSPYGSLAGFLSRTRHIALADTESSGIYNPVFVRFVNSLLTSKVFKRKLCSGQIRYDGNSELFYLHPNRFRPLDRSRVSEILGIEPDESYMIMRFVSWQAYHDKGLSGFTYANKLRAVKEFSKYTRVFISSENALPPELDPYRIKIPPERMHDVLAHARLFMGEGTSMASESALLGTPSIYLNDLWFGYTDEEEEYGLLFNFKASEQEQDRAIKKGIQILSNPDAEAQMQENLKRFLRNKIDVSGFMVWFIENFPESQRIMKENPDYQYNFK